MIEILLKHHDLICNNEPEKATRPTRSQAISIIETTFTTPKPGALDSLIFDEELAKSSNNELIVFDMVVEEERWE